jgi:hypothetical protein
MDFLPVQLVKRRLKLYANTFFRKVNCPLAKPEECRLHPIHEERWIGFTLRLIKPIQAGFMQKMTQAWKTRQKILFRFCFVFLGGSTISCWDNIADVIRRYIAPKYYIYSRSKYAVIYNMMDKKDFYACDIDSNKRTFTFMDNPYSLNWHVFHFVNPAKDQLILTGKWKGRDIRVSMRAVPIDSMEISKEKIKLIRD